MKQSNEETIIRKKLKRHEKILFALLRRTFLKVYNIGRITGINTILS